MRINTVPPSIVTAPELAPQVGDVPRTAAIGPQTPSASGYVLQTPAARQPVQLAINTSERRLLARRGEDRRRRQVAVLLDLRVERRRTNRRRAGDETPSSVDTRA